MSWYAYSTGPIDWWEPWHYYEPPTTSPPTRQELRDTGLSEDGGRFLNSLLFEMYSVALEEFPKIAWEGDGSWYYAGIPGHTSGPEAILAVKQENNGTVFVLSPVPLAWLDT